VVSTRCEDSLLCIQFRLAYGLLSIPGSRNLTGHDRSPTSREVYPIVEPATHVSHLLKDSMTCSYLHFSEDWMMCL